MKSKSSRLRSRAIFVFVCVGVVTFFARAYWLGRELRALPITSWEITNQGDCGIVLTGGPYRVREGFDLLSRGQIKKLIVSGVYQEARLREVFPQWPFYPHWNETDVILERRSSTTYGNAQQSLPLVEALGCRDIVLITSQIHMPRAMDTFRAAFPTDLRLIEHPVKASRQESQMADIITEVLKSWFYDLWVY